MLPKPCLERVIVIPRNGYLNRIQAWASASILAAQFDASIRVLWEKEFIAPAKPEDLFESSLVRSTFIQPAEVELLLGQPHENLHRYLNCIPDLGIAVLAGHDLGEQRFMNELEILIRTEPWLRQLVIIAGGKFHLSSSDQFLRQREIFYRQLRWSTRIASRVNAELKGRGRFNALHIRGTDHAHTAPTQRQVFRALGDLRSRSDLRDLFIAADSAKTSELWSHITQEMGFRPWSVADISRDRTNAASGVDALIDWRLLCHSEALVYSRQSTFSEEAAVASGNANRAIPLSASQITQHWRTALRWGASVLTYPSRRVRM